MKWIRQLKFELTKQKLVKYLFANQVSGQAFNLYLCKSKFVHTLAGDEEYNSPEYKFIGKFEFIKEYSPYSKEDLARLVSMQFDFMSSYSQEKTVFPLAFLGFAEIFSLC